MSTVKTAVAAPAIPPPARPADLPGIPFTRLLVVEWRKQVDTRAAKWLLVSSFVVLLGAVSIAVFRPNDIFQEYGAYLELASIAATVLVPVISIMTLTSEWTRRTTLTTYTLEPRRGRVLTAKLGAGLMLAVLAAGAGYAAAAAGLALSGALGRDITWDAPTGRITGFLIVVVINAFLGMAAGALIQHTAGAIVANFLVPTAVSLLGMAVKGIGDWLDTGMTFGWILQGQWGGHVPQILTSIGIWAVLPLILGTVRTLRREVN